MVPLTGTQARCVKGMNLRAVFDAKSDVSALTHPFIVADPEEGVIVPAIAVRLTAALIIRGGMVTKRRSPIAPSSSS